MPTNPSPSVSRTHLKTSCPQTEAVFRRTENGYARVYFLKSSIKASIVDTFFQNGIFRVEQAFDLPWAIVQSLDLKKNRIDSGLYKVRDFKNFYIIDFDPIQICSSY